MPELSAPPKIRTGQADFPLSRTQFEQRFRARFTDPAFADKQTAIEELLAVAWDGYHKARKSPITRKAGPDFADPDYDLSVDWLAARDAIHDAQLRHGDRSGKARVLLICASARNDKTCPGEMSKTFRLVQVAKHLLDPSTLTSMFST